MVIPKSIQKFFWDTDLRTLGPRSKNFVIARVADKGGMSATRWLLKKYGKKAVKQAVSDSRGVSIKTKFFWKII